MSKARLLDGVDALSARDPDLGAVVARFGVPPLWARRPGFATLVQIVLEQQVSLASARATFGRLRDAWGDITAERFATLTAAQVRSAGVTRQKAGYCLGIAQQIIDGSLDLRRLGRADDEEAHARLVEIRGIGPWTADIYLMCALDRPDIWPAGDLALAVAAQNLLNLRQRPTLAELDQIGEQWRPWRTTAALMLWKYYRHVRSS